MRYYLYVSLALLGLTGGITSCQNSSGDLAKVADEIHDRALTIDTHCDTPIKLMYGGFDLGKKYDPRNRGGKIDFVRMKEGGLDAEFFAVFVGQGPRDAAGNKYAGELAGRVLDSIYDAVEMYPELAEIAFTSADAKRIASTGKRAIYLGMENGYPLGQDLSLISVFFQKGVRYITLCHTKNNDICDSSTDEKGPEYGGMSDFGREVIKEMNRLGMIIDVSHISDKAFFDVMEMTQVPVIASHSCVRALRDHPRNMTDEMLKKLAENGGVIQICFVPEYVKEPNPFPERDAARNEVFTKYGDYDLLSEEQKKNLWDELSEVDKKYPPELPSISDLADHIDHVVKTVGVDYVGIGTDFDGGGALEDCYDVSQMGNITLELLKRGYTEEQIQKIWGGNFLRVFHEVEEFSSRGS